MATAYIIGNGPSRKGLDLNTLDGTIFGCNALFRDYPADYLVSGDSTIIKEICESDYPADNKCIFPDFDPVPKDSPVFNSTNAIPAFTKYDSLNI